MHYSTWLIFGFSLMFAGKFVGEVGNYGSVASDRIPLYFAGIALLIAGFYCMLRAFRGAWADMPWNRDSEEESIEPQPARYIPKRRKDPPTSDEPVDVEEAFARYMKGRSSEPGKSQGTSEAASKAQPAQSSFGRKGT